MTDSDVDAGMGSTTDAGVPSPWPGYLPAGCSVTYSSLVNGCTQQIACNETRVYVSCELEGGAWECSHTRNSVVEDSEQVTHSATYTIVGTIDASDLCRFSAGLAFVGGPAAFSESPADCASGTTTSDATCHRETGCSYSIALPTQRVTVWEASGPDVDCSESESKIACTCSDPFIVNAAYIQQYELAAGSLAEACDGVGSICANEPERALQGETVCEAPAGGTGTTTYSTYCGAYAPCKTETPLPLGGHATQITVRDVSCLRPDGFGEWDCGCHDGTGLQVVYLGTETAAEPCLAQVERCFPPDELQFTSPPRECGFRASLRSGQCVAGISCTAGAPEGEHASYTASLVCEEASDGALDCVCPSMGSSSQSFSVEMGSERETTCLAAANECKARLEGTTL